MARASFLRFCGQSSILHVLCNEHTAVDCASGSGKRLAVVILQAVGVGNVELRRVMVLFCIVYICFYFAPQLWKDKSWNEGTAFMIESDGSERMLGWECFQCCRLCVCPANHLINMFVMLQF